jgi:hypothetical protein
VEVVSEVVKTDAAETVVVGEASVLAAEVVASLVVVVQEECETECFL